MEKQNDARLRMGVLGCSFHYSSRVHPALRDSLLIEPYAVASRDLNKAKQFAKNHDISKAYGAYEELLADPDIDFVYIPLPNHLHLEYIKKSADAGKPVLCEKPLCLNAKEAAEAVAYCKKKKVPLMEAFMYRFHPQWVRAKQIVGSGELGQIMSVRAAYAYTNTDPANIRNRVDCGGGALNDIGCYAVSSARFLMGCEPKSVVASMSRDPVFKTDVLDSAILDFGDGRTAIFTVSTKLFAYQGITAHGAKGTLSIKVPFNAYPDVPGEVIVRTSVGERLIQTEIIDQYLLEFDSFARALIEGDEVPTPISDAVANMAVLDALAKSGASGKRETVVKV